MSSFADISKVLGLVRRAVANRQAVGEVRRRRPPVPLAGRHHYRIALYFADGDVNMYQVRQWYKPLQRLAESWPVVILSRNPTGAKSIMDDAQLPVAFVPTVRDLESYVAEQDIRVVLYVNQNTRNFQMFRYGHRWHVFINHGESDKMYMTTNQFKAYDYALIAGDAARARLSKVLWKYDLDSRTIAIGRPQADHFTGDLPYTPDERTVVLYAPTWEGDRPSAAYGSIRSHGEAIAAAVLASPAHRLVYRPHPRSGVVDPAYGAAHRRIVAAIEAANAADRAAQHVHDDGPELGWQLSASDVAILDISAMVYDRLAAGKPLLVTRPAAAQAVVDTGGYLADAEWLDAADGERMLARVERVRTDPTSVSRLEHWVRHYFGDTTPGASSARFHEAVARLMLEWETWHAVTVETRDADDDEVDED